MNWLQILAKTRQAPWFSTDIKAGIEKRYPGGQWVRDSVALEQAKAKGLQVRAILRNPFQFESVVPHVYLNPMTAAERKLDAQAAIWADITRNW